jgi:bacillithiol biosynthesis cysteine-adding enzyme BshC
MKPFFPNPARPIRAKVIPLPTTDCYPMTVAPGLSRLFLDFCAGAEALGPFFAGNNIGTEWERQPAAPAHLSQLIDIVAAQNPSATNAVEALRRNAGVVITGQQVGLFGGPLFTAFKAASALARARQATAAGQPHVAVFWLASEDHDFDEIRSVTFPTRRELRTLTYPDAPEAAVPVGAVELGEAIGPLLDQAAEILGESDALEALRQAYRPGRTFAQAFADFYARAFAARGLLVFDASSRAVHGLGAPVLRAAMERADELHAALLERNEALLAAGYHAQVAVGEQSSLLFLIDAETGARTALKRTPPSAAEPDGLWHAGAKKYSTAELLGILEAEPERISPAALLRPVFQDFLFSTSLTIGGPAEIAYFTQSGVLYERILGRMTPVQPRFSATIVEPDIAELLRKHELGFERVVNETEDSLTQLLAARAMPVEGKRKLAAAGNAVDGELDELVAWMQAVDQGLGQSAETAAGKIRYQMNRLRQMAANFQSQKEASLARHAQAIVRALYPERSLQERVHGAAWYFARHGFELTEMLVEQAASEEPGHVLIYP